MDVYATIDGRPVALTDWQCDSTINWGYRTLTGKVPASVTWAEQEAPVQLWLPDGTELWAGKLALDPDQDRGKLSIRAEGYASMVEAATSRLLYRHDGGDGWTSADSDPHGYTTQADERYNVDVRPGRLAFHLEQEAYLANDRLGAVFWAEGAELTRYTYILHRVASAANFEYLIRQATGPSGSFTTPADGDATKVLSTADATTVTIDLDNGPDLLAHFINCNTNQTVAARHRYWATGMKVYGRTIDDSFSAGEVVLDVGNDAGFNADGVQTNALAVLPLDWDDDHPALLDYIADLTDWHWEALGPDPSGTPQLAYGPWETTWTGYASSGIKTTWENQKRFNVVKVPFRYVSGAEGAGEASPTDDPLPGQTVVKWLDELEHPQPDATLANAVAANAVEYWASRRVAGRVEIGEVTSETGQKVDGYHVRPGHLLTVPERSDLGPQRIHGMTYRETGSPTADINDDFNVIRLLNKLKNEQRGRRSRIRNRNVPGLPRH